ncbi:FAD/NAD(P)-binding protein [Azospirillum sp. SYSU D00513]|uniref:FAD/NAD(P)-binding protein n=1 Tax=Azospirillum sp. SYSU D00513 TaxID=2812561 RepID=UPI001A97CC10|nr:FAD/NAD(P)-binding protein [Azospirillum sp. SYSU D00513]
MPLRSNRTSGNRHYAIVGAGFTGSVLAAQLLRGAEVPTTVTLIERADAVGAGLAYSTPNGRHLLNVRAANMSAFPDDPHHFLRWLWAHDGGHDVPPSGQAFVSRARYGAYIQDVLEEARAKAPPHAALNLVRGEATDILPGRDGVRIRMGNGPRLAADAAVLCVGHFPPSLPPAATEEVLASGRFIGDPWNRAAIDATDRDAPVLILGTGLTMVDTVLTLLDEGHRGPIMAVSRRGLLPLVHRETRAFTSFLCPDVMPSTALDILIALKADVRRARAEGLDWRSAFDALRPYHHRIWRHLPPEERQRFLRHLRPYWNVHRHRLAPEVASRIEAARSIGQLEVGAGRLRSLTPTAGGLEAVVAERGRDREWRRTFGAVINACGPECDYRRIRHPLVRALLDRGMARPDPLRLGLDVTEQGALIGTDGRESERLFALGPIAKAPFWEMTAVPELRSQCARAAEHLAGLPQPEPLSLAGLGRLAGALGLGQGRRR